jgi:transcriptional regulator with XRE-family HTH domain
MIPSLIHWMPLSDMKEFAARLRALREARKMTQVRLAELLEVAPRVYNRWERGTALPQLETVVRIAQLLQVSLDELAGLQEPRPEPRVRNPKLHALYQEMDQLSDEDQQALIVLMDSLIKRSRMARVLAA